MNEAPKPKRSPWFWVLTGCVTLIVLVIVAIPLLWHFGTRRLLTAMEENQKNPALREQNAKEMLGTSRLPDGYYPASGTFKIPFITIVMLFDQAPDAKGFVTSFKSRGFIFAETPYSERESKGREAFFTGKRDASETFDDKFIKLRARETLNSGSIDIGSEKIRYRIVRGRVESGNGEAEEPMVLMWIDCPGDKKERWAVWFQPEVPDEAAIRTFMSQFDLCHPK